MNTKAIPTALLICIAAVLTTATGTGAFAQTVDDCIACHQDRALTKTGSDGTIKSLYVDGAAYQKSVHGEAGFSCVDCHEDAQPSKHPAEGLAPVKCLDCHDDIAEAQAQSAHGKLLAEGSTDAPECYDCHSTHAVLRSDNPESTVHPDNLQTTCAACHADEAAPVICEAVVDLAAGDPTASERISLQSTLAMFITRLKGHGKTDFGCSYTTKVCSNCHIDVSRHGDSTKEPPVCSKCHDMNRSTFLFGKIHKPAIFTSPMLIILLFMVAVCIGGLVLYFKKPSSKEKEPADEPPDE